MPSSPSFALAWDTFGWPQFFPVVVVLVLGLLDGLGTGSQILRADISLPSMSVPVLPFGLVRPPGGTSIRQKSG